MKKFKRLTKTFAVHAMIFSLLQTSFVFSVSAESRTEKNTKEILNVVNVGLGTVAVFQQQKHEMMRQQIAAQKNMQMMQQLSPSCRKPDGTSCYTVAGKYFPECPLPASMSSMPQNVCSNPTPDPNQISTMITYEAISKSWIDYFEKMQSEVSNSQVPFGMKCLQDKRKAIDSQLTEMVNNLTRLQDQLNKDKEVFRANNKRILEELAQNNDELMGADGTGKKNLKIKTQDFAKYFSQSCQSVIGKDLANGPSVGLLGIMQSLSPVNKKAADYNQNRALIESDIRRDIDKLQKSINEGGLEDYLKNTTSPSPTNISSIGSVNIARVKQASEFNMARERIAKELGSIGYQLPEMDKNFSVDFDEFLAGSQDFFKKQYINGCVTGADKSGVAISTDQILASLKQRSTNSEGTARDKYRAALKTILESDSFIDDKLAQIKALEGTYKDITITYQNSSAQRVTETPYDLYMRTLKKCEERYTQNDQLANSSGSNSTSVSQKKKVERGQALLRELKGLHDNYASNLANRVLDQALNCAGETKKAGSAECQDGAAFERNNTFCMATAGLCANEIQGCFAEANKHVETRKAKMESLAKTFNTNTAALVARSNQLYNVQKNAVMDMVKMVQARFPGTNFEIPKDMFISMPEMKKDAFGIDLANDGNLAFMDDLPKKIELLKTVFKSQQTQVNREIDSYIGKQDANMEKEKGRWEKLANECKGNIDASQKELARQNAEGARAQAKLDKDAADYCRKYDNLRNHPNGACEDVQDLVEDLDNVANRITQNAQTITRELRATCNQYNNESETALDDLDCSEEDKLTKLQKQRCTIQLRRITKSLDAQDAAARPSRAPKFSSLCSSENTSDADFIKAAIGKLDPSEQEALRSATTIDDVIAKAEELDGPAYDFFTEIKSLKNSANNGNDICKSLKPVNEASLPSGTAAEIKTAHETRAKELQDRKKALATPPAVAQAPASPAAVITNATPDSLEKISAEEKVLKNEQLKLRLNSALSDLKPLPQTRDDAKFAELKNIGEQSDGSCDAQASNVNMPKGFGPSMLQNFDNAILGTTR